MKTLWWINVHTRKKIRDGDFIKKVEGSHFEEKTNTSPVKNSELDGG